MLADLSILFFKLASSGSKKYKLRQLDTSKFTTVNRSGINTDFIGFHQRFIERGVAEYHWFAEIILGMDKFIPNPQHIFVILGFQRHPRAKAGVNENVFFGFGGIFAFDCRGIVKRDTILVDYEERKFGAFALQDYSVDTTAFNFRPSSAAAV